MSGFSPYLARLVLDWYFRGEAATPPPAVYVALYGEDGREFEGNGYMRAPVTFAPPDGATIRNASTIDLRADGGDWGWVIAAALWDAPEGGNVVQEITRLTRLDRSGVRREAPQEVNDGDWFRFMAGDIELSLT